MRLILSSCDFSNPVSRQCILDHLPMPLDQCRVLFVPNEKATSEKIRSGKYHARLQEYGFHAEHVYVFDPKQADLFVGLKIDAIYISGGNTFQTLCKLRECGFDRVLLQYIRSGVTYIGGSAGAHLVSQNIEHITAYDEVPPGMTDFSGLGLFKGILICHYTEKRRRHYEALMAENSYRVHVLTDEDSLVVDEMEEKTGS